MARTLQEIARLVGAEVVGDGTVPVTGVAGITEAREGDITFLGNQRYLPYLDHTHASAVIVPRGLTWRKRPVLVADNPSLAFARVVSVLCEKKPAHPRGIHPSAVISAGAQVGADVSIGAHAFIGEHARIGDRAIVYPNVFVGAGAVLGAECLIYSNVTVREECVLKDRVIVHAGSVIGSDGFGYVETESGHYKIPQIGIVVIEDDVEIGACVTIDRARFGQTLIGKGTKIDNLVQIAHNVVIGEHSIIVSQCGISGSTRLGKHVVLAGQVGVIGHIEIGDHAIVGAQSGVARSLDAGGVYLGSPARPMAETKKIYVALAKLPDLVRAVSRLLKKEQDPKDHKG